MYLNTYINILNQFTKVEQAQSVSVVPVMHSTPKRNVISFQESYNVAVQHMEILRVISMKMDEEGSLTNHVIV